MIPLRIKSESWSSCKLARQVSALSREQCRVVESHCVSLCVAAWAIVAGGDGDNLGQCTCVESGSWATDILWLS